MKTHTLSGTLDKYKNPTVILDGEILTPEESQKHHNHSPDGFSWGYMGSGCSQLALAIVLKITGKPYGYMDFKRNVIARLPLDKDFETTFIL